MAKRNLILKQWAAHVFQQYKNIIAEVTSQIQYRLIGVERDPLSKNYLISVQVIGKLLIFNKLPIQDVLLDDKFINCFSGLDVRLITYLGCTERFFNDANSSKIICINYSDTANELIFKIESDDGTLIEKTAAEISLDKSILAKLTTEDAHLVGYVSCQMTFAKKS